MNAKTTLENLAKIIEFYMSGGDRKQKRIIQEGGPGDFIERQKPEIREALKELTACDIADPIISYQSTCTQDYDRKLFLEELEKFDMEVLKIRIRRAKDEQH